MRRTFDAWDGEGDPIEWDDRPDRPDCLAWQLFLVDLIWVVGFIMWACVLVMAR